MKSLPDLPSDRRVTPRDHHQHRLKQRFEIKKKLGQGTYGRVSLAINKETGQEVSWLNESLKCPTPNHNWSSSLWYYFSLSKPWAEALIETLLRDEFPSYSQPQYKHYFRIFLLQVAIKTIKKSKIESDQDLVRIRREIQIMSSIQHPHIIHIYEGILLLNMSKPQSKPHQFS